MCFTVPEPSARHSPASNKEQEIFSSGAVPLKSHGLHAPFTTEHEAAVAEWAVLAPQQLSWFGSSSGTTSPRCSKGYPRGTSHSDDTRLRCSEFIFHTKEKQHNSSFAAQWSLGESTVQSLQALQELPKNDKFWGRELRAQGGVLPWVPCSLRIEAQAPTTTQPFLWKISISWPIYVILQSSPSLSFEDENSRRAREFAPKMQPDPATLEIPNAAETDCSPGKAELHKERTNELQTLVGCHQEVHSQTFHTGSHNQ